MSTRNGSVRVFFYWFINFLRLENIRHDHHHHHQGLGLVWVFFCLMAYQPSWVIQCQSHSSRRTAVMLLNPLLGIIITSRCKHGFPRLSLSFSLSLSLNLSLSSIAFDMSSKPHPLSAQSFYWYVLDGQPALTRHLWAHSCFSSNVCFTCIFLLMDGKWSYSCSFLVCCFHNFFQNDS